MLKVNDFFCGAGGMGLGFKQAGFRLAGAWDFDKYAVESYGNNVSPKVKQSDITQMTWEDIPYADVWTFGFPCQDVSIAKNNGEGLKGQKSGLFYEIMRLLEETKKNSPERLPSVILAENVKNLKKDIDVVKEEYSAKGYRFYKSLIDSQDFGIPQHRERYFLLGVLTEIEGDFEFPDPPFPEQPEETKLRFKDILEDVVDAKYYINKPYTLFDKPRGSVIGLVDIKGQDNIKRIYDTNGIAPTLTTSQGGYRQPKIIDDKGLRRITPREYARLQGFEDDYKQVVSDTQMYKQMGNAVSVPVAREIAEAIKSWLIGETCSFCEKLTREHKVVEEGICCPNCFAYLVG